MSDKREVKITSNTRAEGKSLTAGKKYMLSSRDADFLCQIGKAEEVSIQKAKDKGPMTTKTAGATVAGK